jgi:hypothetical protein
MAPSHISTVLLTGVIVFAGHLVKGVSGFGSALSAVPLTLLFLDVKFVTPLFLLFDLTSGAILVSSNWRSINRRLLSLLLCGILVGSGIGTLALLSLSHRILKRVLGILVTGWALATLVEKEPRALASSRPLQASLAPLGRFLGGVLGATFGVNGPPIIIYLSRVLDEKDVFRGTLYGVFFADACYRMALFAANRLLSGEIVRFALLMTPFLVAGVVVGSWLQRFLNKDLFRRIVAAVLAVAGVMLLV